MDFQKAKQLRQKWNGIPCNHPSFEVETFGRFDDGGWVETKTGDYVCSQCGETFTREEKEKIEKKREKMIVQLVTKEQKETVSIFKSVVQVSFPNVEHDPIILASYEEVNKEDVINYLHQIGIYYDNYRIVCFEVDKHNDQS